MIITVLSRDKLTQNIFKAKIANVNQFCVIGTHSNQDDATLKERISLIENESKIRPVIVFHALKRSAFLPGVEWNPEATADYPRSLLDISDVVVYTPNLYQQSYGRPEMVVLKGDASSLAIS